MNHSAAWKGRSIMVVDDQPDELSLLEAMLRQKGYQPRSFPSGHRALAAAVLHPPDLVLLDIAMPGVNGFEVCRRLKADAALCEIPVLFLSALTDTEAKVKALRAGGVDFITKPFQFEEVYVRIETHLKLRDLQRALKLQNDELELMVELRTSELSAANAQLREGEERFRLFMSHLPAAAYLKDRLGRYIWGNAAWRKQFPDNMGDLAGKTDSDLWPPEVAAGMALSDARVWDEGEPFQSFETASVGSERRQWLVSKFSVRGQMIGGVSLDTTENHRLELELGEARKLEAIGLLAGGVAHDFNNILTIILGHAELGGTFAERAHVAAAESHGDEWGPPANGAGPCASAGDDQIRQSFGQIREAALRASGLTRQLLAFGRKQVLLPRTIGVNEELVGMERILHRVLRENVSLEFSLAPDTDAVDIDPVQFQQVIFNLAMNAQDAMAGGGSLTIETANVPLDEACGRPASEVPPGPYVMLAVTDTGSGMDEGTLAHLFEPFFTTKATGEGTGLGLATVYGIVRQSGGHIWVYSEPQRGTSFRIYFPRTRNAAVSGDPQARRAQAGSSGLATGTVLIVEDEEAVRSLMVKVCIAAGYQVLSAARGDEAAALAASCPSPIHLLVTDMILPDTTGRELAERILKAHPNTEVLFSSGYPEETIVLQEIPGTEFLSKPFTIAELLEKIQSLLSRRCTQGESRVAGQGSGT